MKLKGKHVVVTGGTGLVGQTITRHLLERGATVTSLSRRAQAPAGFPEGAAVAKGDVTDRASLDFTDADVVVHTAAWVGFGLSARKRDLMMRTNVGGTQNVINAAVAGNVERLLHVSSVAALGRNTRRGRLAEDAADQPRTKFQSTYERSKYEAHQLVMQGDHGLDAVAVLPSVILGLSDSGSGLLLTRFLEGKMPVVVTGDKPTGFVHVEDVADGALRALERGEGTYVLNETSFTQAELVRVLEAATGQPAPPRRIPMALLWPVVAAAEAAGRVTGRTPPISFEVLQGLATNLVYDSSRARGELGWKPDLRTHLRADAARWRALHEATPAAVA